MQASKGQMQSDKRIVITGASGVGKTSLATLLAAKMELHLIPEVARELCHQMGFSNPTEIPDQASFRTQVLQQQIAVEGTAGSFISDRSTIDCWLLWQRWQICSAMTYDTEAYYDTCRAHAASYTHIVYVPPMFEPVEDNFRWTDKDYMKQIDRTVRTTLYDWDLIPKTLTLTQLDNDKRMQEVLNWLSRTA